MVCRSADMGSHDTVSETDMVSFRMPLSPLQWFAGHPKVWMPNGVPLDEDNFLTLREDQFDTMMENYYRGETHAYLQLIAHMDNMTKTIGIVSGPEFLGGYRPESHATSLCRNMAQHARMTRLDFIKDTLLSHNHNVKNYTLHLKFLRNTLLTEKAFLEGLPVQERPQFLYNDCTAHRSLRLPPLDVIKVVWPGAMWPGRSQTMPVESQAESGDTFPYGALPGDDQPAVGQAQPGLSANRMAPY